MREEYDLNGGVRGTHADAYRADSPTTIREDDFEMKAEYDFSNGVRGAHTQRFQQLNLVSLDDDVKVAFPDSEAVNTALRQLMKSSMEAEQPVEFPKAS